MGSLLVLGGTAFVGRYVVEAALAGGHEVTLFNRGRRDPELFPEAEKLRGDRDGDLAALEGRRWDAAVDTTGYVPRVVRASAALLAEAVGHYTFVSSASVYDDTSAPGVDESAPVATVDDESTEDVLEHYGALKALCERELEAALPGRVLVVRAGLIVGPHDYTGRLPYWIRRIAEGGEVLAPEPRDQPVQLVDVRDLADWIVRIAEERVTGVFNVTGPERPLTTERLLDGIRRAVGSDASFVWAAERFLLDAGVEPWSDLPLWLAPESNPGDRNFLAVDVGRARAAGLRFRPLAETAVDTLAWDEARRNAEEPARDYGLGSTGDAGLSRERERELLDAWRRR